MQCYKHPREETYVSCGKCDRPICPKCMVNGPAGLRCRECASLRSTSLYKVDAGRLVLTAIAAGFVGIVGAAIISELSFLILITSAIYGGLVAEVVMRVSGHKQGPVIMGIGIGAIVLGFGGIILWDLFFATAMAHMVAHGAAVPPGASVVMYAGGMWMSFGWHLIGAAIAISTCYGRLKYF